MEIKCNPCRKCGNKNIQIIYKPKYLAICEQCHTSVEAYPAKDGNEGYIQVIKAWNGLNQI